MTTHGHLQIVNPKSDLFYSLQLKMEKLYTARTRPRADCGSDHQLLIAKYRLKFKKVVKTNRQLRYDLNQIPYDYTVEVTDRFKGLDLIECLKNYGWRFGTFTGGGDQDNPQEKEMQKCKIIV